jgi:bisphosphoglycerate-independent phosphoglycerate mutase (AlkP superfamily)
VGDYEAEKEFGWRGPLQKELGKYPMAEAVRAAYQVGEDDETLEPLVLVDAKGKLVGRFRDGDYVIFYNLRGEREVELCQSLLDKDFSHFPTRRSISGLPTLPISMW